MDVKHINPFLDSVQHVFKTMVGIDVERIDIKVGSRGTSRPPNADTITSLVQISGGIDGFVALCFPSKTAYDLAGRLLGEVESELNAMVIDAIGELGNLVAGSAKAKFEMDPPPTLALPTVFHGADHRASYPARAEWLEVPFVSEAGSFTLEVTVRPVS